MVRIGRPPRRENHAVPDLASWNVRSCRPTDLAAVVEVMQACDVEAIGEPDTTEADVAEWWDDAGFDLASDAWVATDAGGTVLAYAEVSPGSQPGHLDVDLYDHPDRRRDGVAAALLDRAVRRAAERAADEPGGRATLSTWSPVDGPNRALLEGAGFRPSRLFFRMRADLDDPATAGATVVPDGIDLRPMRPGVDEAAVHAGLVEAFADHVRPVPPTLEQFLDRHTGHADFDPSLWTVAWDRDDVAGAIMVLDHGDLAFVRDVGVRGPWRGRGLGQALLRRTYELLRARGQHRVDLGVDAEDPVGAVRLYERVGFTVLQRTDLLTRPIDAA